MRIHENLVHSIPVRHVAIIIIKIINSNITRACGFTEKITNDEVVNDFV